MRCHTLVLVTICTALLAGTANGIESWMALDGPLTPTGPPRSECGVLLWNADGSAEGAFAWQYGGVVPPYYGAFAERYEGEWEVCAQVFGFTTFPESPSRLMDMYIWSAGDNEPGSVLCVTVGVDPGPIARYPHISYHLLELGPGCCTGEVWWAGYWGVWPGGFIGWYVAGDLDGPLDGFPMTNIAPGLGYPSGWQHLGVVWGPIMSLFMGAEVVPCVPTSDRSWSWGRVKSLYTRGR